MPVDNCSVTPYPAIAAQTDTATHLPERGQTPNRVLRFAILGAAKSGTTWMQRLLSAHPQIHCAESRAFGTYFDPNNPTAVHITVDSFVQNLTRYYHPPAGADDRFYEQLLFSIVDAIGSTALRHCAKSIYGEKITPYWGTGREVVERLASYNPALRLVHLIRDPRDVVVSGFVHQANIRIASDHPRASHYRACLDSQRIDDEILESSLALWLDTNAAAAEASDRFDLLLLRYEDLLDRTLLEVQRLLLFIGASHDGESVDNCTQRASFQSLSGGRSRGEEDRTNFFRKGVAGDWVNWLSAPQLNRIEAACTELMHRYGYKAGSPA
jgi:hypothetical protein